MLTIIPNSKAMNYEKLDEFPNMTQRQFIDHLTDELDKRFRYID